MRASPRDEMCERALVSGDGPGQTTSMRLFSISGIWLLAGLGCSSGDPAKLGGQTGEESFGCLTVSTETASLEQTTRLGFSGNDVLTVIPPESTSTFTWSDASETPVTVSVTVTGDTIEVRDNEWKAPTDGREIGSPDCADAVAIEAQLTFSTGDGAFDESFDVVLIASTPDVAHAHVEREAAELSGSYEVTELQPAGRRVRLFWTFTFDTNGSRGSVDGQAEDLPGDSPDGTVSAQGFDIGTFGEE